MAAEREHERADGEQEAVHVGRAHEAALAGLHVRHRAQRLRDEQNDRERRRAAGAERERPEVLRRAEPRERHQQRRDDRHQQAERGRRERRGQHVLERRVQQRRGEHKEHDRRAEQSAREYRHVVHVRCICSVQLELDSGLLT